eukprot:CAMPEP_0183330904 /NCGR_PEP_ID=MMETSP0164_2-20130417/346_1 /TAXON_ID=221442 /ORGANISM="Coccolithus pelagicus ssp braarudi, Strain PLY182g" /LENGTH=95 /DNA_ID=CAMNT_0025499243 /DNA_START=238 /DNA_END=525 /DNA_ORIENTATION=+
MGHVLPATVAGRVGITIRLAHYVAETDLHYDATVRALFAFFTLRTATLSTIWTAASAVGLDFARVSGATFELAAFQAREQFRSTVRHLPIADRTI